MQLIHLWNKKYEILNNEIYNTMAVGILKDRMNISRWYLLEFFKKITAKNYAVTKLFWYCLLKTKVCIEKV